MTQKVFVNLHTHERTGSQDSDYSMREMYDAYRRRFDVPVVIGFVAHDDEGESRVPDGKPPTNCIKGTEVTVNRGNDLHIVRFPQFDFSFLAHPRHTFSDREERMKRSREIINTYDLDGVEWYRSGKKQFKGYLPEVWLSNDDAHSPHVVGSGGIFVEVEELSVDSVMGKVRKGDFKLHVNSVGFYNHLRHQVHKTRNMLF